MRTGTGPWPVPAFISRTIDEIVEPGVVVHIPSGPVITGAQALKEVGRHTIAEAWGASTTSR
jgi:hypothetical protein